MKTAQYNREAKTTIRKIVSVETESELIKIADEIGVEYGAVNETARIFCNLGEKPTAKFKNYDKNTILQFYRVTKKDNVIEIILENSFRKDKERAQDLINFRLSD